MKRSKPDQRPGRATRRRWLRRAVLASLVFGALLSLGLVLVLTNLDKQPVKGWLTGAIRDATGMAVDFDALSVDPGGQVSLRGLRIASPAPFDAVEPVLLAVGVLDAEVDVGALLDGDLVVSRLEVEGVRVAVVQGAGRSSLDALIEGLGPPSEEEPVPPSQALALPRMEGRVALAAVAVRGIAFVQVGADGARSFVEGLSVTGDVALQRGGATGTVVVAGGDEQLVRLAREGTRGGEAELDVRVELSLRGPHQASLAVRAAVSRQTLWPEPLPDGPLLALDLDARFLPERKRISLFLKDFSAFGGAVSGSLQADLVEAEGGVRPVLRGGSARARVPDTAALGLTDLLQGVTLRGVALDLVASDMAVEPGALQGQPAQGVARLSGTAEVAVIPIEGGRVAVEQLTLDIGARATGPSALDVATVVQAAEVRVEGPAGVVLVEGARLDVDGRGVHVARRADARGTLSVVAAAERLSHRGAVALDTGPFRLAGVGALDGGPPYRATVEGPIARLALADAEGTAARVEDARVAMRVEGLGGSMLVTPLVARARVEAASASAAGGGAAVALSGAAAELSGVMSVHGLNVEAHVPVRSLAVRSGDTSVSAEGARLHAQAIRLSVPKGRPQDAEGHIRLLASADELSASTPAVQLSGSALTTEARATLRGGAPYGAVVEAGFDRLSAHGAVAPPALRGGRISIEIKDFQPAEPLARSVGVVSLDARLLACGAGSGVCAADPVTVSGTVERLGPDAIVDVTAASPGLGPWVTLMRPSARRALSWSRLGGEAHVKGSLAGGPLGDGPLRVDGSLDGHVTGLGFRAGGEMVEVPSLRFDARLKGAARAFEASATFDLRDPRVGDLRTRGPLRIVAAAGWAASKPSLRLAVKAQGAAAPDVDALVDLSFDRRTRRLRYDARADVQDVGLLAPLLPPGTTLDAERATLRARGALTGVVRRFDGPMPVLEDELLAGVDGDHELTASLRGLRAGSGGVSVSVPSGRLDMTATGDQGEVTTRVDVRLEGARVTTPKGAADAGDVALQADVSSRGEVRSGVLEGQVQASVATVAQDLLPGAPLGDVRLLAKGRIERLDGLRIDALALTNGASGSRLDATAAIDGLALRTAIPRTLGLSGPGDVEPIPGRTSLTVQGTLTQDVARAGGLVEGVRGSGTVRIPFVIESGDRSLYRVAATVEADRVNLLLSELDLELTGLDGQVAIEEELDLGGEGIAIIPGPGRNAYSQARFQDVHPFLLGESFLTLERLRWRRHTMGPFAGNLRVRRNVISLDQLQLEHQGGNITGQLIAELKKGASSVLFRGNVTGLRPSGSDEVLDANAALMFSPEKLELEGRVQIVRMGRGHLRDALDLLDPYSADPNMNTIRTALSLGYPEYVRLRFHHGFLSAKVELGGLADVVRIDEIRGIATGPLLHRYVGPLLRPE